MNYIKYEEKYIYFACLYVCFYNIASSGKL